MPARHAALRLTYHSTMLRIFAFRGYFIAAYAQEAGEGRYIGYAHICVERPRDMKSIRSLERVQSVGVYDSDEKAMHAAEFQARQAVESLKPNWAPFTEPGGPNSR